MSEYCKKCNQLADQLAHKELVLDFAVKEFQCIANGAIMGVDTLTSFAKDAADGIRDMFEDPASIDRLTEDLFEIRDKLRAELAAKTAECEALASKKTRSVSAVAGVVFRNSISDEMKQALHDFGEHRRDMSLVDWSPPVWRETLEAATASIDGGEPAVIEAIYHAIRRGWRNFYFPKEVD